MKTLDTWLSEYGESHQNPVNKTFHWICVPLITFCVFGFFWAAHPALAIAAGLGAMAFYLRLSRTLAMGMALISAAMLYIASITPNLLLVSAVIFVLAWIGQFIGHAKEGKKPSFFKDLQFLLIGPIWLLAFAYQKADIPR